MPAMREPPAAFRSAGERARAETDASVMRDIIRETFPSFIRVPLLHPASREPIFGSAMIEELKRHDCAFSPGTLCLILHGLETAGYLRSESRVIDGKVRRYDHATARDAKALES
jgi:DNA-binding PadR family transcriptional regulator